MVTVDHACLEVHVQGENAGTQQGCRNRALLPYNRKCLNKDRHGRLTRDSFNERCKNIENYFYFTLTQQSFYEILLKQFTYTSPPLSGLSDHSPLQIVTYMGKQPKLIGWKQALLTYIFSKPEPVLPMLEEFIWLNKDLTLIIVVWDTPNAFFWGGLLIQEVSHVKQNLDSRNLTFQGQCLKKNLFWISVHWFKLNLYKRKMH